MDLVCINGKSDHLITRAIGPALGLIAILIATTTHAANRPDTRYMSCSAAVNLIQTRGAMILNTSNHRYQKYVKNHAYCNVSEYLKRAYVPTQDNRRCNIGYVCQVRIFD